MRNVRPGKKAAGPRAPRFTKNGAPLDWRADSYADQFGAYFRCVVCGKYINVCKTSYTSNEFGNFRHLEPCK